MPRNSTRKLTLSALLVAVMLILGYIESFIPVSGVPGIKLGLSNSVLLLAISWLGIPAAFFLMVVKVLLSGFLFSGVSAMLYALAGGLLSMIVMSVLYKTRFHLVVVGMAGAVAHNIGQILVAMAVLGTDKLIYYMAILMIVGLVTGFVTGMIARLLMQRLPANFRPKQDRE